LFFVLETARDSKPYFHFVMLMQRNVLRVLKTKLECITIPENIKINVVHLALLYTR